MRKTSRFLWGVCCTLVYLLTFPGQTNAQCTTGIAYLSGGPATCSSTPVTLASCYYAGEYRSGVALVGGNDYTFSSSVETDFITITNADGTVVYESGTSPVSYSPAADEAVRVYIHLDENCGTESECRAMLVSCSSDTPDCEGTPGGSALPGTACDDGNPNTLNDTWQGPLGDCACVGVLPPSNTTACNAIDISDSCGEIINGTNVGSEIFDNCNVSNVGGPGVWYVYTATETSTLTIETCLEGTDFDTDLSVYQGSCDDLSCYTGFSDDGYNDGFSSCTFSSWATFGEVPVTAGETYYIYISGYSALELGNFAMSVDCGTEPPPPAPENDLCENATPFDVAPEGQCDDFIISNAGATDNGGVPSCDSGTESWPDTYYAFNSGSYTEMSFEFNLVTGTDLVTEIFPGCDDESIACLIGAGILNFEVTPDTDYILRISSNLSWGDPGDFSLCASGISAEPEDCAGVAGGTASIDDCGVCSGGTTGIEPNSTCLDCNGDVNGDAFVDDCGVCAGGNTGVVPNETCTDCNGDVNGNALVDDCGVCAGGNTGIVPNETCTDCNGDVNGDAYTDNCGNCVGGNTGAEPCAADCNGDFGGTAFVDQCGVCAGGETGVEPNTTCLDCNGDINGDAYTDNCGNCVGGNTGAEPCAADCNGDFGGTAFVDQCGVCAGGDTGVEPNTTCLDCNGDINGDAYTDNCGNCVGGNTGAEPCAADCNGDFGGTAFVDQCGVCAGGETGVEPNTTCLDCNGEINGDAVPGSACTDVTGASGTLNDDCQCIVDSVCDADGGEISTDDPVVICVTDGIDDNITVSLEGAVGQNMAWVLTDLNLNIIGLSTVNEFNLDGTGVGTTLIWHLSWNGDLAGAEIGENAGDLVGDCFDLSNPITVVKEACGTGCVEYAYFYADHGPGIQGTNLYGVDLNGGMAELTLLANYQYTAHISYDETTNVIHLIRANGTAVDLYDLASGQIVEGFALDAGLSELYAAVFDPTSGTLYVGSADQDMVYAVDPSTGSYSMYAEAQVSGGDLAITNDKVYLARRQANSKLYSLMGGSASFVGNLETQVTGMATMLDGNLLTSHDGGNKFYVEDIDGNNQGFYTVMLDGAPFTTSNGDLASGCAASGDLGEEPDPCYGSEALEYMMGTTQSGNPIADDRTDPGKALGAPQDDDTFNFVSLGYGGSIIIGFNSWAVNGDGPDIQVFETTFGDQDCSSYPEAAEVYASQDGVFWELLGTTCTNEDGTFDLGSLPYASYVKLVDITDAGSVSEDGFDVDAVVALHGCGNPDPDIAQCEDFCLPELNGNPAYVEGTRSNGGAISIDRTNPERALAVEGGDAPNSFVSLGYGGSITLCFNGAVRNDEGPDLQIVETSFGDPSCGSYPEYADVDVSVDGNTWYYAGTVCLDGTIDISDASPLLDLIYYVRISNNDEQSSTNDAYDVDGVVILSGGCSDDEGTADDGSIDILPTALSQEVALNDEDNGIVIQSWPNPAKDMTVVSYTLPQSTQARVELLDTDGRPVAEIYNGSAPGEQEQLHQLNVSGLSNGIYVVRIITQDGGVKMKKVIVQH